MPLLTEFSKSIYRAQKNEHKPLQGSVGSCSTPCSFFVFVLFCFDLQSLNAFTDPSHSNQLRTWDFVRVARTGLCIQKHCWHRDRRACESRKKNSLHNHWHALSEVHTQGTTPDTWFRTLHWPEQVEVFRWGVYPVFSESECFPYKQCTMYSPSPLRINVLFFFVSLVSFFVFLDWMSLYSPDLVGTHCLEWTDFS